MAVIFAGTEMRTKSQSKALAFCGRAAGAVGVSGLGLLALIGTHSRNVADDYSFRSELVARGFWGMQSALYKNWSGRLSATFLQAGLKSIDGSGRVLPLLILLLWVGGVRSLLRGFGVKAHALSLAAAVVTALNLATPLLFQTLFWESGSISYALPQALAPWFFSYVVAANVRKGTGATVDRKLSGRAGDDMGIRGSRVVHRVQTIAVFIAMTFTSMLSETGGLVLVVLTVGFAVILPTCRKQLAPLCLGAFVGFAVMAMAPGNDVRQQKMVIARSVSRGVRKGFVRYVTEWADLAPRALASAACALILGWMAPRLLPRWKASSRTARLQLGLCAALFLVGAPLAAYFLGDYATYGTPARASSILVSCMLVGLGLLGSFVSSNEAFSARNTVMTTSATLGSVLGIFLLGLGVMVRLPHELQEATRFSSVYDNIVATVESSPSNPPSITLPRYAGGLIFLTQEQFSDPNSMIAKAVGRTDTLLLFTDDALWGDANCRDC